MDKKQSAQGADVRLNNAITAMKYALLYVGIASIWIMVTDRFVAYFDESIVQLAMFQTYKGLSFVAFTGILLFSLLYHHYSRVSATQHKLKETRDDLLKSQRLYRNLVETSSDLIWSIDVEGRITFMNQASRQIYGREPEEMIGHLYTDFIPPEQIERNNATWHRASLNNDRIQDVENFVLHKDGHRLLLSANAILLRDEQGQVIGSMGVSRDITQQKSREKQLEFQANLLDAVQQAVIATNLDGEIIYWNQFAEQMYGWTSDEVMERHIAAVTVPKISEDIAQEIIENIKKLGKWSGEFTVSRKDGSEFPAYITNSLFYDEDQPAGIIGLSKDISERKQMEEALKNLNNRLQTIVDVSPVAIVAVDKSHKVQLWNRAAEDIFGWQRDEVLHQTNPFIPEDRWHELKNNMTELETTGGAIDRHVIRQHKDGRLLDLSMSTTSFKDHQGETLYLALFIDITPRLKARKELENAKILLEKTFASLTEAVLVIDTSKRTVVMCNPAVQQILGYSPDEVIGKNTEFLHVDRDSYLQFGNLSHRSLEKEGSFSIEYQMKHKDGHLIETENTVALLNPEAGLTQGAVSVIRDITVQKQTLRELADALKQQHDLSIRANTLRRIAENLVRSTEIETALNFAIKELHSILPFNGLTIYSVEQRQLEALLYYQDENAVVSSQTIHYPDYPLLHNAMASGNTIRLSGFDENAEFRSIMNFSADVQDWIAIPLISRGITMGLLSACKAHRVFSDIETDLLTSFSLQLTSALDNVQVLSDLQESYRKLELAQEKTVHAARLSAIGELAAGVAHQINNPLMTVIADSHLLLKHTNQDSPLRDSAEAINRAAQKAGKIVERLLDFARTSPAKMIKVNINESLLNAIQLVRSQIESKHTKLNVDLSADIPPVWGSENHLQDIWLNLILNARDAVQDVNAGLIQISTVYKKKDGMIHIVIADNGVGIDKAILENIFNPFYTTKKRGTGLGLSICADIVRQHHGTINVESEIGQGTRFIVRLPSAK